MNELDILTFVPMREVGVRGQHSLFNSTSHSFHSIPMSALYAIITVIEPVLLYYSMKEAFPRLPMLMALSKLVTRTFWWPVLEVYGHVDVQYLHGK